MRRPHLFHSDPDWQVIGLWAYSTCRRCDAVRIHLYAINLMGPCASGWSHLLVDHHGRHVKDSGWVRGTGLTKPTRSEAGLPMPMDKPPPPPGPGGASWPHPLAVEPPRPFTDYED